MILLAKWLVSDKPSQRSRNGRKQVVMTRVHKQLQIRTLQSGDLNDVQLTFRLFFLQMFCGKHRSTRLRYKQGIHTITHGKTHALTVVSTTISLYHIHYIYTDIHSNQVNQKIVSTKTKLPQVWHLLTNLELKRIEQNWKESGSNNNPLGVIIDQQNYLFFPPKSAS